MESIYEKLYNRNKLDSSQFELLENIHTNKVISVYYDLRLVLYLGILLLGSGVGLFAYQNMGQFGHVACMVLIFIGILACFYFIRKYAEPYSNTEIIVQHPYYDYILLLSALLIIGLFGYIQVYFGISHLLLHWSTLVSAIILLYMAYRFDNKALLSMGITALAATVGISISPVDWVKGAWLPTVHLYNIGLVFGTALLVAGWLSETREIKKHFRFTYSNFGLLIGYVSGMAAMFSSDYGVLFGLLLLVAACFIGSYSWQQKELLFFLYSILAGFVAHIYLFFKLTNLIGDGWMFLFYYLPVSCIVLVVLLIKYKSHFKND